MKLRITTGIFSEKDLIAISNISKVTLRVSPEIKFRVLKLAVLVMYLVISVEFPKFYCTQYASENKVN